MMPPMPQAGTGAISLRGVSKVYRPPRKRPYLAIEQVALDVAPGRFVAVVGPSGCGKSTLLSLVSGLLPPTTGEVTLNGTRVTDVRTDVGYIFQRDALLPWRTVRENVALPLRFRGRSDPALVQDWIVRVGLGPFGENYPHELSGGMRKRAQLAQSLVADPTVLLMDAQPHGERAAGGLERRGRGRSPANGAVHHARPRGGHRALR